MSDLSTGVSVERPAAHVSTTGRATAAAAEQPVALPVGAAPVGAPTRARWLTTYRRRVLVGDVLVVLFAVGLAQWSDLFVDDAHRLHGDQREIYLGMSVFVALSWLAGLQTLQSRSTRYLGAGPEEYVRVLRATATVFGLLTVFATALRVEEFRGYLFVAAPVGGALLLLGRFLQRRHLGIRRARGLDQYRVLLVGRPESARDLIATLHRDHSAGHLAVGLCVPANEHNASRYADTTSVEVDGQQIPVLGTWHEIDRAITATDACTVAVMSSESLDPTAMRELSWRLDELGVDMVVAPNLVDVDMMRVTTRPVAGLPLLHIEGPRHEAANRAAKAVFDRVGAALLLLLFSPVMVTCALLVALTSKGPVFYTAPRVGVDGRPFPMVKFRSMVQGADRMKTQLLDQNEGDGVLFKMRDDPRVTPVGRVLRRYSLDELPQLFNVLAGHMSLVGPRPPLRSEVDQYSTHVARRLYVRPGMTGLWQVSGRSDLSWDEAVRLDLSYVENWSMGLDIVILWRTLRAVLRSEGAY